MSGNMNYTPIGKCSICGSIVSQPQSWMSVNRPVPKCESCGAVADQVGNMPTIPMKPARVSPYLEEAKRGAKYLNDTLVPPNAAAQHDGARWQTGPAMDDFYALNGKWVARMAVGEAAHLGATTMPDIKPITREEAVALLFDGAGILDGTNPAGDARLMAAIENASPQAVGEMLAMDAQPCPRCGKPSDDRSVLKEGRPCEDCLTTLAERRADCRATLPDMDEPTRGAVKDDCAGDVPMSDCGE